ncbi:flagellar hook-length control protein [Mycobacteroides chelonae]|uniref:flagellar hook-length control protein n=1 Tax=Mycobacteroides chelonae TaxID=1774 RepID=UPI000ABA9D95|nr:flagellar hook-length control protein [Mycobacteroides chelonae]
MTAPSEPAQDAIKAAMTVAKDVAEGRLDPAALDAAAEAECRQLFGFVTGPGDPLWELHVEVARQVLALDGIPVDELAEWLAVTRKAQGVDAPADSWMVRVLEQMADEDDCPHLALDPTADGELLVCRECGELLPDLSDDDEDEDEPV